MLAGTGTVDQPRVAPMRSSSPGRLRYRLRVLARGGQLATAATTRPARQNHVTAKMPSGSRSVKALADSQAKSPASSAMTASTPTTSVHRRRTTPTRAVVGTSSTNAGRNDRHRDARDVQRGDGDRSSYHTERGHASRGRQRCVVAHAAPLRNLRCDDVNVGSGAGGASSVRRHPRYEVERSHSRGCCVVGRSLIRHRSQAACRQWADANDCDHDDTAVNGG